MTAEAVPRTTARGEPRAAALDGIRGIAIVLVLISHGWALWSMDGIDRSSILRPLFTSGNFAVSVFFVVGGFVGTRSLLHAVERHGRITAWDGMVRVVRRAIRLGAHVWALLAVVLFVAVLDPTENMPEEMTRKSVFKAGSFTWNWYLRNRPTDARPDFGHLWYVCVDVQVFIMLVVLVWWLGHRPLSLVGVLAGLILVVTEWRAHALTSESLFSVELRTTTRMDGLLWGAAAAVALPYVRRHVHDAARYAGPLLWGSLAALTTLMFMTGNSTSYYRQNGVLINAALVVFVLTVSFLPRSAAVTAISFRPLALLGRHSLPIYIWHYPIFWGCARWAHEWGWGVLPKTLLGFGLTALMSALAYRVVERPVQSLLARDAWHDIPGVVRQRLRTARRDGRRLVGSHRHTRTVTRTRSSAAPAAARDLSASGDGRSDRIAGQTSDR